MKVQQQEIQMKDKFFSMVGFIFDSIKVLASIVVIAFVAILAVSIYRVATVM
jgi:hypothetical protein